MQLASNTKLLKWIALSSLALLLINKLVTTFLYGTQAFLVNFAFFVSIGLMVYNWIKSKFPKKYSGPVKPNIEHGSAKWATHEEFLAAGQSIFGTNGVVSGLWIGDSFVRQKQGHLMTIAGSGQGKGTCLIIPSLLVNPNGSFVVTDPKGENACITAKSQRDCGQNVYILDPWGEQEKIGATHGIPAAGFNPFDFIKANPLELRDNCELVAYYLVPENPQVKDPYWDDRARALIKLCLMHIITDMPEEDHNFWTLYKMVRVSGTNWLGLLADMKLNDKGDGLISLAAEEFIGMDPAGPTIGGIRSNAQNATSIFESPHLRASLQKSEFNPYNLTQGKSTVYIVIPERYLETHSAWLRLVIGICLKACNSKPDKRVNFLLDEAGVIGKMKDIEKAYAFARGQNVVLWTFFQSLSQVKENYGENGMNSLISNCTVFQAFGSKDQFTKEYVSKALGETTVTKASTSVGTSTSSAGSSSSSSTSISTFGRPLLMPDEVENCKDIITITSGLKYLIYRIGYHENRFEKEQMNEKSPRLDKTTKKLLKDGQTPNDLREAFAQRADPPPRVYA